MPFGVCIVPNCEGTVQCCKNLTHLIHLIKLRFWCLVCQMCHIITFSTYATTAMDALMYDYSWYYEISLALYTWAWVFNSGRHVSEPCTMALSRVLLMLM